MVLEVRRAARRPPSHRSISPSSDSHLFIAFFAWLPSPQATMICIDNSEWMRNGDYSPSRFQAQADAVNLICGAKTQVRHRPTRSIRAALVVCDLGFWAPDLTVFFSGAFAVQPGEHGGRHDDGRKGRARARHSHQRPRQDPRLYAR